MRPIAALGLWVMDTGVVVCSQRGKLRHTETKHKEASNDRESQLFLWPKHGLFPHFHQPRPQGFGRVFLLQPDNISPLQPKLQHVLHFEVRAVCP